MSTALEKFNIKLWRENTFKLNTGTRIRIKVIIKIALEWQIYHTPPKNQFVEEQCSHYGAILMKWTSDEM
jgi:hypothetical protein